MYDVWISRSSSMLSMVGSSAIIYIIISARRRKLLKPKNRFMLMMSVFDVLQSAALVVSTAALPQDTGIYGAMGNSATCTAQSIIMGLGLAVPLYNSSLNLFYLLTIRYNMNSTQFSTKLEPFLHAFSVLGPVSSTITLAALGYSKPVDSKACLYPGKIPTYGYSVIIVSCFLFCIYSMGIICWSVIRQAKTVRRHRFASSQTNRATILEVEETIKQALSYSLAFFLTFSFPMIHALIRLGKPESTVPALSILSAIFYPLQGFFNFIFYIRPGINHVRKIDSSKSLIGALKEVIFNAENVSSSLRNNSSRSSPRRSNCRSSHSPRQLISAVCIVDSMGKSPPGKGEGEVLLSIEELATKSFSNAAEESADQCALSLCKIDNHSKKDALDDTIFASDEENGPDIQKQPSSTPTERKISFVSVMPIVSDIYFDSKDTARNDKIVSAEENGHNFKQQPSLKPVGRRVSLVSLTSIKSTVSVDSVSEEGNEDNEPNVKRQPSRRQSGGRASLVSLASIMSDIAFDSASDGDDEHINEPY